MADARPTLAVQTIIDSLTWGGAESVLADLAAAAPSAGIAMSVAYLRDRDGSPSAGRLREAGVEPVLLGTGRLSDPRSLQRVRRHLATARPDVVHTHLDASDVLGGLAARSLGLPVVSTVHLIAPAVSDDPGLRGRAKRALSNAARAALDDRVLTVSDAGRRTYVDRMGFRAQRVVTLHNGIVPPRGLRPRADVRAELGIPPGAVVATMVAVLRPAKGHAVALEAVDRLRTEHPELVLLVLGDGPSRAEVERLAAPLGTRAVLTGHRDDVADLLGASDIVLHPTEMDAFPTSLLEAAAAGLPAVATAVGGIPEIVEDGRTGLLLGAPTADAVEQALRRLLGQPALRAELGAAARQRFASEFSAESWALRLRDVYEQCLRFSGGRPRPGAHVRPRRPRKPSPSR